MAAPFMLGKDTDNGLVPCRCNHFIPPHNPGEIAGFEPDEAQRLAGIKNKEGVPAVTILVKVRLLKHTSDGGEPGDFLALEDKEAKEAIKKGMVELCSGAQVPDDVVQAEINAIMHSKDVDQAVEIAKEKKAKKTKA